MIKKLFNNNIERREISIDFSQSSDESATFVADNTGIYPLVNYQGITIANEKIMSLKLNNDNFLPSLEITFQDQTNRIVRDLFPLDNEVISIFIRSTTEKKNPIRMDFKILDFQPKKPKSGESELIVFSLLGVLDVNPLYYSTFRCDNATSFEVLKKLAQEFKLGFASNISNTNDKMKWINPNDNYQTYIEKITENSYYKDEGFMWSFIDFYYNLNFFDIETQLEEDIKNQKGYTDKAILATDKADQEIPLLLTNHPDFHASNQYIDKFSIKNDTTDVNLSMGYKTMARYMDRTNNQYNAVLIDTISTAGPGQDQIIMKDEPLGKNEKTRQNEQNELYNNVIGGTYLGKIDQDNMHKNYFYADLQNKNNIEFLKKIKLTVNLKRFNFNFTRYQKVLVEIYHTNSVADPNNTDTPQKKTDMKNTYNLQVNERLSGEWLIVAINYVFSKEFGNTQEITLVKRELSSNYQIK
jgi:hypothetical protein